MQHGFSPKFIKLELLKLQEMEANVTANCVHPGIVRTRLTRDREGLITGLTYYLISIF